MLPISQTENSLGFQAECRYAKSKNARPSLDRVNRWGQIYENFTAIY